MGVTISLFLGAVFWYSLMTVAHFRYLKTHRRLWEGIGTGMIGVSVAATGAGIGFVVYTLVT